MRWNIPYPNFHAARILNPGRFDNIVVLKTLPNGIMLYGGRLKGEDTTTVQAYRFPKNKFTTSEAKNWLKNHDISYILFEKATGEKESVQESIVDYRMIEASSIEKKGKEWEIIILEGGESINRFYYSDEVLKKSVHLFEGIDVYAHKFGDTLDHRPDEATNPNGLILNKVGWVDNIKFKSGIAHGKLIGSFHCVNSTLSDMLVNTWDTDKSKMPQFSVDVTGNGYQSGNRRVVTEIRERNSLDIVSYGSAGGKFERMVASINIKEKTMEKLLQAILAMAKEGKLAEMQESIKDKSDEDIMKVIKEALGLEEPKTDEEKKVQEGLISTDVLEKIKNLPTIEAIKAAITSVLQKNKEGEKSKEAIEKEEKEKKEKKDEDKKKEEKAKEAVKKEEETKTIESKVEELNKKIAVQESMIATKEAIANDKILPARSKERIMESLKDKAVSKEDIDNEIKKEKQYLEDLSGSGEIKIKEGTSMITVEDAPRDKKQKALDMLVDPDLETDENYKDVPRMMGIREAFERFTGIRVQEAINNPLRIKEATTADFPIALGDSMNKKIIKLYKMYKEREVWTKFTTEENITNLNEQTLSRFGGFEDLDTVAEGGLYTELTTPSEDNPTYTPLKKGNVFTLTEEMLINDNLRALRKFPKSMAKAAIRTLSKFVFNLVTGCDGSAGLNTQTIYDDTALYTSGHSNLGASALDYDPFEAGVTAMNEQTEADSAEPLYLEPKWLLASTALRREAWNICKNELIQANANGGSIKNAMATYNVEPLIIPKAYLCGSAVAWFLIASKDDIEGLVVGYLNNKKEPEILLQDQPTTATVFTNDQIKYRVKFRYGGCVTDYRGFYGYPIYG